MEKQPSNRPRTIKSAPSVSSHGCHFTFSHISVIIFGQHQLLKRIGLEMIQEVSRLPGKCRLFNRMWFGSVLPPSVQMRPADGQD